MKMMRLKICENDWKFLVFFLKEDFLGILIELFFYKLDIDYCTFE